MMEKNHKQLGVEDQFETMKRGIIETASKKSERNTIDALRGKRFCAFNNFELFSSLIYI